MAEIVDNSIQACKNNKELGRVIKVFLYLKKNGGSFLAVMDNGCGMNIDKIRDFATYSLDQETRNQFAEKGDKSFISKFGVGVKQAGFFLGDRVRVLTKTIDTEEVSEFSLDRESFEEKTRNKQNPYSSTIKFRRKGVSDLLYPDERSEMELVNKIMEHEEANNQFTTILIRLHADMSKKLRRKLSYIPLQLADIYHFQLHPENRPEHMVGER